MRTALLSAMAFMAATAAAAAIAGGPCYSTPYKATATYRAATPVYAAPAYQAETKVVVVNNVVGVPVQVPYDKPIALQGSTQYGYTDFATLYPDLDFTVLFQRSDQAIQNATDLTRSLATERNSILKQVLQDRQQSASTLAAAQALREVIRESAAARITTGGDGGGGDIELKASFVPTTREQVLKSKCVSCHAKYSAPEKLTDEEWGEIYDRATHDDPKERMPRAPGGKTVGVPLTRAEKILLTPDK